MVKILIDAVQRRMTLKPISEKPRMDWRKTEREAETAIEFSFEGVKEMEPCSGRAWAVITGNTLDGIIFFHHGDESRSHCSSGRLGCLVGGSSFL